jgi:hypothetical protein
MLLLQQVTAGSTAAASTAAGAATTSTAAVAAVHKNILLEFETASAERRAAIVLAELLRLMGSHNSRAATVAYNAVSGMPKVCHLFAMNYDYKMRACASLCA